MLSHLFARPFCKLCDKHLISIFRIVGLWMSMFHNNLADIYMKSIAKKMAKRYIRSIVEVFLVILLLLLTSLLISFINGSCTWYWKDYLFKLIVFLAVIVLANLRWYSFGPSDRLGSIKIGFIMSCLTPCAWEWLEVPCTGLCEFHSQLQSFCASFCLIYINLKLWYFLCSI